MEECIPMNPCANDGLSVPNGDDIDDILAM